MEMFNAIRISIIVERVIQHGVLDIIEEAGAKGYSFFHGEGKGVRHSHPVHRPSVAEGFSIIKIEAIVGKREAAEKIVEKVADAYFDDFPGIVYLDEVEILRREKF